MPLPLLAALFALAAAAPAGEAEARRPPRALPPQRPLPPAPEAAEPFSVRPVRPRERAEGPGRVVCVAAGRAYLDAGAGDGLAAGAVLALARGGRPAASCTVELLSDRSATCLGDGVRPGDAFALPAPPPAVRPAVLAQAPVPEEQARRLAAVEAAPVIPVEHRAARPAEVTERIRRAGAEVALVHASWRAGDARGMHQELAEVRLAGAEVAPGWRVFLDAAGVYRTALSDTERFRAADRALFLVREAQVSAREAGLPVALAAGRVLPWRVVGAGVLDGVQAGWRLPGGSEIGIFGGGMPEPETTAPTLRRATGGAYWSLAGAPGAGLLLRQETRLAWTRTPEAGSRLEAEALGEARLARVLDLSGQVRFGFGGITAPSGLDAARLDLGTRLGERFSLWGSFRYQGLSLPDLAAPALFPAASRHLDAAAGWEVHPGVTARLAGGWARDLASRLERGWAGPELAAPRLFGAWGGLSAGYVEERGWLAGRSAWVQGDFRWRGRGPSVWGRLTWLQDGMAGLPARDTLGLALGGRGEITDWLRLRLWLLTRFGTSGGEGATSDLGVSAVGALEAVP